MARPTGPRGPREQLPKARAEPSLAGVKPQVTFGAAEKSKGTLLFSCENLPAKDTVLFDTTFVKKPVPDWDRPSAKHFCGVSVR